MHSNTNHPISLWSVRITIPILSFYLLLVLPGKNILFHTNPWGINHTDTIYYLIITSFAIYRLNFKLLGFSIWKNKGHNLKVNNDKYYRKYALRKFRRSSTHFFFLYFSDFHYTNNNKFKFLTFAG